MILQILHVSSSYATTSCVSNRLWLLSAWQIIIAIRGHVHVALYSPIQVTFCAVGLSTTASY